jgi:hypothetical protein
MFFIANVGENEKASPWICENNKNVLPLLSIIFGKYSQDN